MMIPCYVCFVDDSEDEEACWYAYNRIQNSSVSCENGDSFKTLGTVRSSDNAMNYRSFATCVSE